MNDYLQEANADDEYGALPDPIKSILTRQEWLWLSDFEKARLLQDETEPEWAE